MSCGSTTCTSTTKFDFFVSKPMTHLRCCGNLRSCMNGGDNDSTFGSLTIGCLPTSGYRGAKP